LPQQNIFHNNEKMQRFNNRFVAVAMATSYAPPTKSYHYEPKLSTNLNPHRVFEDISRTREKDQKLTKSQIARFLPEFT